MVLVPPLFERDHRGRSRIANSSYDWLFAKPALKWLFHDYIDNNAHALLRLSPGEDPRVSITARVNSSLRASKGRNVVVAEQNSGAAPNNVHMLILLAARVCMLTACLATAICTSYTSSSCPMWQKHDNHHLHKLQAP